MIVAFLLAFTLGALAGAAALAYRAHRRAARFEDELDVVRAELEMAERRDHDTGLWNSRHFVEALTREVERSRTYARPVALALASVDGLLEEGDDTEVAMAEIGNAIGASVRALDIACRVGSTEFGVIMCETDSRNASVAAERLLRAIARVRGAPAAGRGRHRRLPGPCRDVRRPCRARGVGASQRPSRRAPRPAQGGHRDGLDGRLGRLRRRRVAGAARRPGG